MKDKIFRPSRKINFEKLMEARQEIERLKEDISNYVKITLHDRKEIDRLNNIINELEKYINEEYIYDELGMKIFDASELQDKLQELKGDDKDGKN